MTAPVPGPAVQVGEHVRTGWTEAFAAAASADAVSDLAAPEPSPTPSRVPVDDPFVFAAAAPPPQVPDRDASEQDPFAGFRGSAVTDLDDLEQTAIREAKVRARGDATGPEVDTTEPWDAPGAPPMDFQAFAPDAPPGPADALSLEERTPAVPAAVPEPAPFRSQVLDDWGPVREDGLEPMPLADSVFAAPPGPVRPPPLPTQRGVAPSRAEEPRAPEAGEPAPREVAAASPRPAGEPPHPSAPAGTVQQPPVPGPSPSPARWRSVAANAASLGILLAVTAGLLLWWRGDDVGNLARRISGRGGGDVVVVEVSSGTYPNSAGHLLVYVRGAVRARVAGPVRVRAEMLRDGTVVESAEGVAGALPDPEELASLSTRADLDALRARLEARAATAQGGARRPFLVPFLEPPGNPGSVTFRVDAVRAGK